MDFIIALMLVLGSCRRNDMPTSLAVINDMAESNPRRAIAMLDSLSPDIYSGRDRAIYDLLRIKTADKTYVRHTSDSLFKAILDEINVEKDPLGAEIMYYGGRIYTDLGDYPTALDYYQRALELLPKPDEDLRFKSNVVYQRSQLLVGMRLYKEGYESYRELCRIDSLCGDTVKMVNDIELLASLALRLGEYSKADSLLRKHRHMAGIYCGEDTVISDMYLATVFLRTGRPDSAAMYISHVPWSIKPGYRNLALGLTSEIYLAVGKRDSVRKYATMLVNSKDRQNLQGGYASLLSPVMKSHIPVDSLVDYVLDYREYIDEMLNRNADLLAIAEVAKYNYSTHEKAKLQAEKKAADRLLVACVCVIVVMLLIIYELWQRKQISYLRGRLSDLTVLEERLKRHRFSEPTVCPANAGEVMVKAEDDARKVSAESSQRDEKEGLFEESAVAPEGALNENSPVASRNEEEVAGKEDESENSASVLRKEIREKLDAIANVMEEHSNWVEPLIDKSRVVSELRKMLRNDTVIPNGSELWNNIEKIVFRASPKFKENMKLLTGGKLKPEDYHIALLIRCGFKPKELGILMAKTKGGISNQRQRLGKKLFGENIPVEMVDRLIRTM